MRQDITVGLAGVEERFDSAASREPYRYFFLNWRGKRAHLDGLAAAAKNIDALTTPEPPNRSNPRERHLFPLRVVFGSKYEIVRMPARGKRNPGSSAGKIID